MVEIRPSRPEEIPAQKRLWKLAFGDEEKYIDWFYRCCGQPENMLLLLEEGQLASMLALLPQEVVLPGGETAQAGYIYALATDPAFRSHGFGRQLLHYADFHLRARGADCVTTVPAQPSLFKFFATVGFTSGFSMRETELLRDGCPPAAPGDRVRPVEAEEYNAIRERLLEGVPHIRYGEELIRYQQGLGQLSGGGLYRVEAGGAVGCAAAEYVDEESLLFKELLLPPEQMSAGLAALACALPAVRCHVRTPAAWEGLKGSYLQPFAMIKWYRPEFQQLWQQNVHGYMGLGFD